MRKNILLVDDDPSILELVGFFLQNSGFVIKTCKDGHSAFSELLSNPFDLVILDITLPHMNGLKLLKKIRTSPSLKDIPVIMLTGSNNKEDILSSKQFNVTDYLIKPPTRENFLKRLDLALGGTPQFEEVKLEESDPAGEGTFILPMRLKSVSKNGFILTGNVPLEKESIIKIDNLELFKKLLIKKNEYKIVDCAQDKNGSYEYMISSIGLTNSEHERIREWIMMEIYRQKNKIAG